MDMTLVLWYSDTTNDINMSESPHLFLNLAQGIAHPTHYVIQGKKYELDNMYPKWSTSMQTIHEPRGPKKKYFVMR